MRIAWIAAIALAACALVYSAWTSSFDHDEVEHLHAAWLVGQWETPFVDFLEQHHPAIWYSFAPLTKAIETPKNLIFAARLFDLMLIVLFLCVFMLLAKNIYPESDAKWGALLLLSSFTFARESMEFRPDPLMNLLSFIGIYCWAVFLRSGRLRQALFAGLVFGLAVAVLQKAAVVLALTLLASVCFVIIGYFAKERERALSVLKGTLLAVVAAAGVLALYFSMFAGHWDEFFFWNYTFNKYFYLYADVTEHFSVWSTLLRSFEQNALIWMTGVAGFVIAARGLWRERKGERGAFELKFLVLFLAAGYGAFLLRSRFPFSQYLIVLMPLLALFFFELDGRAGKRSKLVLRIAILAMCVEMTAVSALYKGNAGQVQVQQMLLNTTGSKDRIFAPPPYHPVFRRDGAYFWYNASMIADVAEKIDAPEAKRALELERAAWERTPPAVVYIDEGEKGQYPFRWEEMKKDYSVTPVQGLFVR